jgi:hypothetical protein
MRLTTLFVFVASSVSAETKQREKSETINILSVLTTDLNPKAMKLDDDCIFSQQWFATDSAGPQPALTFRQAVDPRGNYPERFCDRYDRFRGLVAKAKSPENERTLYAADIDLSYPLFDANYENASVILQRVDYVIRSDGKTELSGRATKFALAKENGRWIVKITLLETIN